MAFSWTGPLEKGTEVSLANLTNFRMQHLIQRVARMWFDNTEGQEVDLPEDVVLMVVVGKIDDVFQYENAGNLPPGFVFEDDQQYHLLQHGVIQIRLGATATSYIFATNGARIVKAIARK